MSHNKVTNVCRLCNTKVQKFDNNNNGFMEVCKHEYHFACVEKYGYQKFCSEVINYIRQQSSTVLDPSDDINKPNKDT